MRANALLSFRKTPPRSVPPDRQSVNGADPTSERIHRWPDRAQRSHYCRLESPPCHVAWAVRCGSEIRANHPRAPGVAAPDHVAARRSEQMPAILKEPGEPGSSETSAAPLA